MHRAGDQSCNRFVWLQDLVIPCVKIPFDLDASPLFGAPARHRDTLLFFRGETGGAIPSSPGGLSTGVLQSELDPQISVKYGSVKHTSQTKVLGL